MGLDSASVAKDTLVSDVEISAFVPVVDFLKLELPGLEIGVGSLVDCVCFEDMAGSPISLISSCEALFCTYFRGESVSMKTLLEELVFLSEATCLKCLENLFEIELLFPWTEIL